MNIMSKTFFFIQNNKIKLIQSHYSFNYRLPTVIFSWHGLLVDELATVDDSGGTLFSGTASPSVQ